MISVKDYIENPSILEAYYTPYQQKCMIVDQLIDTLKVSDEELWIIDYAQLQPVKDSIFVSQITNLDMATKNEEDLLGYDQLKEKRKWDSLIASIRDEYDEFNNILELKLKTIREYNAEGRVLNEIGISIVNAISNFTDKLVSDLNISELTSVITNALESDK